jgi:hypothetical protein
MAFACARLIRALGAKVNSMGVKERIISEFLETHNIDVAEAFIEDLDGVYWLINIRSAIDEDLRTRANQLLEEKEPTWAITRSMLDRVYEHIEGGFISLFTGAWASVEVICRASLEAAINVLYVLESDTTNRLSQYMYHYFEESLKSIDRYEGLVITISGGSKAGLNSAVDARNMLAWRREIIEAIFQHDGIPFGIQGWPKKIIDRFKTLGLEFEYREIYASLSSQVHNDADALIDFMILKALEEHVPKASEKLGSEVFFWLRHFLYRCLEFYSDAAKLYATKYSLVEAETSIEQERLLLSARLRQINNEYWKLRNAPNNSFNRTRN